MKTINKIALISLLSFGLTACGGFFDKDNTPPPSPLVNFTPESHVEALWYTNTGMGVDNEYLKLAPAVSDNGVYTADRWGKMTAVDKTTGKILWQVKTGIQISSGVAAGDNTVVAGGSNGYIVALNQADGKTRWRKETSTEILASPAIANGIVIVKTIDGKVTAYDVTDGNERWSYQQAEPNLILRGSSAPQMTHHNAIIGFANGNLINLSLQNGNLLWEKTIATPTGSFTIQRMVDIDANPFIIGNRIYVTTYQGRISALELSSGQELWSSDMSSYTGITGDANHIYVTDTQGVVWAFDAKTGASEWKQTDLTSRNITGPASLGNNIVVGDGLGYLHWINKQDGHFVARTRVNRSGIIASPLVNNETVYVTTKDGHAAAYRLY